MFEHIIDIIEKNDSIVIFGHKNPDGDCYGAAVGLKAIINLKYPKKKVYIVGSGLPEYFDLLMPMDEVDDKILKKSLAILVDSNDLGRAEDERINRCAAFAKIDHHIDIGTFTIGPSIVDELANSTCDIITAMVLEQNLPLSPQAANALYLGIITDSARYQFVNDYIRTFERVAFLIKNGASPNAINKVLNVTMENSLSAKGFVYSNYRKSKEGMLYIVFTRKDLKAIGMGANDASVLVNLLANVKNHPVWASFAEYEGGSGRLEIRSNGPAVQPFALSIGGGGHLLAAGATINHFNEEEINKIVEGIDNVIREWREKQ